MTVLILTLAAVVFALTVALGIHELVAFVRGDGYRSRGNAPRSHHADVFDPWGRAA